MLSSRLRKILLFPVLGWLLLGLVSLGVSNENGNQRILLICSYDASFPTFPHQIEGLRAVFDVKDYDIDIEFIDSKRIPGPDTLEHFAQVMEMKTRVLMTYDLIITADDNALKFIQHYGERLFPGVPVVFLGVNDLENGLRMNQVPHITGVLERISFQANVDLMHRMFPKATRYHILFDGLPTSQSDWRSFQQECEIPEGVDVIAMDLSTLTFERLYEQMETLDEQDLVFILAPYMDASGRVMRFYGSIANLLQHCHVPVFHPYQHGVGQGLLGGMVVSHYEQARAAAIIGKQVLDGADIAAFPVVEKSPNRFYLDAQLVKKFKVARSQIPTDVTWINESTSFFQRYKYWILGVAWFGVFLTISALGFFSLWRRERLLRKELEESEMRNSRLFQNPFAIMFVLHPETGAIIDANEAAVRFYGYSRKELLGMSIFQINTLQVSEVRTVLARTLDERRGHFRFKHRLKCGDIRDVEVFSGPVQIRGEALLFSIVRDITDVIDRERLLEKAKEAAENASRAKDQFLSMMSHEMRTPLNPIVGFITLLLDEIEDPEQREQLEMMYDSAERLRELVENVLHFNKLNVDGFALRVRKFNLVGLLRGTHKLFSSTCRNNEVVLENHADRPVPEDLHVFSDPDLINHILCNFLGNACKFTENGRVVLRSSVVKEETERILVRMEVQDNGIGIEPGKVDAIFDPFFRIDNSLSETSGVGLGLSICEKMAQLLHAELGVDSNLGVGSCFSLQLWLQTRLQTTSHTIGVDDETACLRES